MVNDYRRGRAGTVSHTVSQSMVKPGKRGGGLRGGGGVRLFGLHWETTASQDGQKVRLNKEMKRNLRKMDEPPGKHPLFIPLVLQMITNALSPPFSLRAHTRRSGAGRREELPKGG